MSREDGPLHSRLMRFMAAHIAFVERLPDVYIPMIADEIADRAHGEAFFDQADVMDEHAQIVSVSARAWDALVRMKWDIKRRQNDDFRD